MELDEEKLFNLDFKLTYKIYKKLNKKQKYNAKVLQKFFNDNFDCWSKDKIKKFFKKNINALYMAPKEIQNEFMSNETLKYLSKDIQLKAVEDDDTNIIYASDEIKIDYFKKHIDKGFLFSNELQKKIVFNNNLLLQYMREDVQLEICKDKKFIKYASMSIQDKIVNENPKLFIYASNDYKINISNIDSWNMNNITKEALKEYIKLNINYNKETFNNLLNKFYETKKLRQYVITLVRYSNDLFIDKYAIDIYLKCNKGKSYKRLRRSKQWRRVMENK